MAGGRPWQALPLAALGDRTGLEWAGQCQGVHGQGVLTLRVGPEASPASPWSGPVLSTGSESEVGFHPDLSV